MEHEGGNELVAVEGSTGHRLGEIKIRLRRPVMSVELQVD